MKPSDEGEVFDSNRQAQVGNYLAKLNEARLYVHRDKPRAKALLLEVETLLKAIPGCIVTVNKAADAVDREWHEARIKKYETGMLNALAKLHEWEHQYSSQYRELTEQRLVSGEGGVTCTIQ